jgi:4-diphosphocytidyl-2-C-methyl-D-erythritol kinase
MAEEIIERQSPAKINLMLRILKRREDGYHEIRTIFQKISLRDTLRFSLTQKRGVSISTRHPRLPRGEGNLVYRAGLLVLDQSAYSGGVRIEIDKRIPVGAGLGGGSSNAATTLMALNELLELGLTQAELMRLGLTLGADVPFFMVKGSALGSGIGERLKRIRLPEMEFVLINPNFEISTAWAYSRCVLTRGQFHYNIHRLPRTARGVSRLLWNDLEQTVLHEYPQVKAMKDCLISAGALGALMTGSGPTVFGVFAEGEGAREAYAKIKKMVRGTGWIVFLAHSVDV